MLLEITNLKQCALFSSTKHWIFKIKVFTDHKNDCSVCPCGVYFNLLIPSGVEIGEEHKRSEGINNRLIHHQVCFHWHDSLGKKSAVFHTRALSQLRMSKTLYQKNKLRRYNAWADYHLYEVFLGLFTSNSNQICGTPMWKGQGGSWEILKRTPRRYYGAVFWGVAYNVFLTCEVSILKQHRNLVSRVFPSHALGTRLTEPYIQSYFQYP